MTAKKPTKKKKLQSFDCWAIVDGTRNRITITGETLAKAKQKYLDDHPNASVFDE